MAILYNTTTNRMIGQTRKSQVAYGDLPDGLAWFDTQENTQGNQLDSDGNPVVGAASGYNEQDGSISHFCDGVVLRPSTQAEKDAWILADYKKHKNELIDRKTRKILGKGFDFDNQTFSLSANAQLNMKILRDEVRDNLIPYGQIGVTTAVNGEWKPTSRIEFLDISKDMLGYVKNVLDAGRALKVQVNATNTLSDAQAVSDDR
jgi:hypothetical protein